jgi:hypothetical protein
MNKAYKDEQLLDLGELLFNNSSQSRLEFCELNIQHFSLEYVLLWKCTQCRISSSGPEYVETSSPTASICLSHKLKSLPVPHTPLTTLLCNRRKPTNNFEKADSLITSKYITRLPAWRLILLRKFQPSIDFRSCIWKVGFRVGVATRYWSRVADSADFIREFALIVLGAFLQLWLRIFYRDILGRILKM